MRGWARELAALSKVKRSTGAPSDTNIYGGRDLAAAVLRTRLVRGVAIATERSGAGRRGKCEGERRVLHAGFSLCLLYTSPSPRDS